MTQRGVFFMKSLISVRCTIRIIQSVQEFKQVLIICFRIRFQVFDHFINASAACGF